MLKEVEIDFVISENLTASKLIKILEKFEPDTPVDSVRLKASSNAVYAALDDNNEIVIGD